MSSNEPNSAASSSLNSNNPGGAHTSANQFNKIVKEFKKALGERRTPRTIV